MFGIFRFYMAAFIEMQVKFQVKYVYCLNVAWCALIRISFSPISDWFRISSAKLPKNGEKISNFYDWCIRLSRVIFSSHVKLLRWVFLWVFCTSIGYSTNKYSFPMLNRIDLRLPECHHPLRVQKKLINIKSEKIPTEFQFAHILSLLFYCYFF